MYVNKRNGSETAKDSEARLAKPAQDKEWIKTQKVGERHKNRKDETGHKKERKEDRNK